MNRWQNLREISSLAGLTLANATGKPGDDEMVFVTTDGRRFVFFHEQDCCESVAINDVVGDLSDLVGSPLVRAEERTSSDEQPHEYAESWTWTFYEFATNKGSVTVRWLGESNGYYGESVSLAEEPTQ